MGSETLNLSADLKKFVEFRVASGEYDSQGEYIRVLIQNDFEEQRKLDTLNSVLDRSIAEADAGDVLTIDEVRLELKEWNRKARNRSRT